MTPLSSAAVKERRQYFLTQAAKKTKFYKGDKRVSGVRMCAICMNPLSKVILSTGKTQAVRDHYNCYFSELFYVDICLDSRVCQKVHKKLREGD